MIFLNIGYYIQLLLISVSQGGLRKGAAAFWKLIATQNHLPQAGACLARGGSVGQTAWRRRANPLQRQAAAAMPESKRLYCEYARTAPDVIA